MKIIKEIILAIIAGLLGCILYALSSDHNHINENQVVIKKEQKVISTNITKINTTLGNIDTKLIDLDIKIGGVEINTKDIAEQMYIDLYDF